MRLRTHALRSPAVRVTVGVPLVLVLAGCAAAPRGGPIVAEAVPRAPIGADSGASTLIAPGVVHHALYRGAGPWAIHVLEVDRGACWTIAALKGDSIAVGRTRTSALLARGATSGDTVAAVNADFFLFSPPGVPTGPHVDDGMVVTGPGRRPAVLLDSAGGIRFAALDVRGAAHTAGDSMSISEWNHLPVTRLGAFDQRWGARTDTTSGAVQVAIDHEGRVLRVATQPVEMEIPRGGWVLAAGRAAPARGGAWLRSLRAGDRVSVRPSLGPAHPMEAVGGFPLLVRDSALAPVLDSAHVRNLAQARHPRTAVGMSEGGRRLWVVVVDGRAPGYSAGMTLPELAALLLELGARDAINLDGGGSSAMAVRRRTGAVQVVNRPSDAGGERAVANALAIVRGCGR